MSVNTHLYVGNRWGLEDIKRVLEATQKTTVKCEGSHTPTMQIWHFRAGDNDRMMFVHLNSETGIGRMTLLSLGHNPQAIKIMRGVADILGGLLQESDCEEKYELIRGDMYEGDGLPFFVKHAITEKGINKDDGKGLMKIIDDWKKEYSR